MAEQNKIFPEGDLKQNRMYIENFDDFKDEIKDLLGGEEFSNETLKAIYDKVVTVGAIESNLNSKVVDIEGTDFVKDTHSLKSIKDLLDLIRDEITYSKQPDAYLDQSNPTVDEWYTVLNSTFVRIDAIGILVNGTDETIEVKLTVDGNTWEGSKVANAGELYSVYQLPIDGSLGFSTNYGSVLPCQIHEGRSVKVEFRKTTSNGTANIQCRVPYHKRRLS
jgi:hypothetical protein